MIFRQPLKIKHGALPTDLWFLPSQPYPPFPHSLRLACGSFVSTNNWAIRELANVMKMADTKFERRVNTMNTNAETTSSGGKETLLSEKVQFGRPEALENNPSIPGRNYALAGADKIKDNLIETASYPSGEPTPKEKSQPPPESHHRKSNNDGSTKLSSAERTVTHQRKALAEQRRREAVKETSIDLLAIENLRAMARMSEDEVKQTKNLITCFLSGVGDEKGDQGGKKGSRLMKDFQRNMGDSSKAYHYHHNPSLPLPQSLLSEPPPSKKQKTNNAINETTEHVVNTANQLKKDAGINKLDNSVNMENIPSIVHLERKRPSTVVDDDSKRKTNDEPSKQKTGRDSECNAIGDPSHPLMESAHPQSDRKSFTLVNKQWVCESCRTVPPSFRAEGAISDVQPSHEFIDKHKKVCRGESADLSNLVNIWLDLTRSSTIRFNHLSTKEFKAAVHAIVGGNADFITLFTDDIRKTWQDPQKYATTMTRVQWSQYPFSGSADRDEKALKALADFARTGVGFDFVENSNFVKLLCLIAPGFKVPSQQDLIEYW